MKTVHRQASISRLRAARLYKLLRAIESQGLSRGMLLRKLKIGMRTFYRDLDILRTWGIEVAFLGQKYSLTTHGWLERLPLPDPELSFAEAQVLAAGDSPAARKVQQLLTALTA